MILQIYATVASDLKGAINQGQPVVAMMEWWWYLVSQSGTGGITGRPEGGQWQKISASPSRATTPTHECHVVRDSRTGIHTVVHVRILALTMLPST